MLPLLLLATFAAPLEAARPTHFVPPAPTPQRPSEIHQEEDDALRAIAPVVAGQVRTFNRISDRIVPVIQAIPRGKGVEILLDEDRVTLRGWVTGRVAKAAVERAAREAAEGRLVESQLVAIRMRPVEAAKP